MPRGYLKHNSDVCRKKSRGGGSRRDQLSCRDSRSKNEKKVISSNNVKDDLSKSDFALDVKVTIPKTEKRIVIYPKAECVICFEKTPVIPLSKHCSWHDSACKRCLRQIFVTGAQKDTKNYPLRCFHPQCRNSIHICQLREHGLITSTAELQLHYEMNAKAKREKKEKVNAQRREKHQQLMKASKERRIATALSLNQKKQLRTVLCPHCENPQGVCERLLFRDLTRKCNKCRKDYWISPHYTTLHALERLENDSFGRNDGYGKCPKCGIIISKGNGCSHMICGYCQEHFDWGDAVFSHALAYPHPSEIHLWW